MCGIAGFIDKSNHSDSKMLKNMTDVLHHRGPDDSGYFFTQTSGAQVALGHRRLSILDLSAHGHQPMKFENLTIVYNGEVYNFTEVKRDLEKYGYSFESHSDTEVLLKAYHKWGIDAIQKFNGMFAMAIFDAESQKVTLIRDRAGVKPLYWYQKNELLIFSSELKSMHQHSGFQKELDFDSLTLFLKYGYILEPYSIFKYTRKLKAGYYLEISLTTGTAQEKKYWDVIDVYNQPKLKISENEAIAETERLLKSACKYRMVADVPVGVFLSGGYDSAAVTALIQSDMSCKLKTFTIGFHEEVYNEAHYAKEIAKYLGTDHTEYYCTQKEAVEIIPLLPDIYDEPFGDSSAIPTTLISRLARQDVAVSLSADGGDEIFGGYDKYTRMMNYRNLFDRVPYSEKLGSLMCKISPKHIPILNRTFNFDARYRKIWQLLSAENSVSSMNMTSQVFIDEEVADLLVTSDVDITTTTSFDEFVLLNSDNDMLDQMLAIDFKTFQLDDVLVKVDRASMSTSLESREPLLDYRIIEFVSKLHSSLKINTGQKKYILKEVTHKYIPKKLMDRPKMGFSVPVGDWFEVELKMYLMTYLDPLRLKNEGIFNPELIVELRDSYLLGNKGSFQKVWLLLVFQMWYEKWM